MTEVRIQQSGNRGRAGRNKVLQDDTFVKELRRQLAIDWLDQATYESPQLDDFIVSIEDCPEKINTVLDFIELYTKA